MENAFGSKIPKQVGENAKYKLDILVISFENEPELFSLFLRITGYKIDEVFSMDRNHRIDCCGVVLNR